MVLHCVLALQPAAVIDVDCVIDLEWLQNMIATMPKTAVSLRIFAK